MFCCHENKNTKPNQKKKKITLILHSRPTATDMRRIIYLGKSLFSNLFLFLFEVLNIRMFLITRKFKNEKKSFSQTEETSCKNMLSRLNQQMCAVVFTRVRTQNTEYHETTLEGFKLLYTFSFIRVWRN